MLRLAIPSRYVRVERAWRAAVPDAGELPAPTAVTGYEAGVVEAGIAGGERMALAADPRPIRLPSGEWVGAWAVTLAEYNQHLHCRMIQRALRMPITDPVEVFSNDVRLADLSSFEQIIDLTVTA